MHDRARRRFRQTGLRLIVSRRVANAFRALNLPFLHEFEQVAMERVRARSSLPGFTVPARFHARLGARAAGLDLELLQRIQEMEATNSRCLADCCEWPRPADVIQSVVQSACDGKTSLSEVISATAIVNEAPV